MKQNGFRRWLESQSIDVTSGSSHLKFKFHGRRSVMLRHPYDEVREPLRKVILEQFGLS